MVLQPPLAEELQRVRSGRGLGQVNGASLRRCTPIGEFLSAPLPEGAQWRQVRAAAALTFRLRAAAALTFRLPSLIMFRGTQPPQWEGWVVESGRPLGLVGIQAIG